MLRDMANERFLQIDSSHHDDDDDICAETTLEAIDKLHRDGKFKEFGVSNYAAWQVVEIYHICKAKGWVLPTIYQVHKIYIPLTPPPKKKTTFSTFRCQAAHLNAHKHESDLITHVVDASL